MSADTAPVAPAHDEVISVSALNRLAREVLEREFPLLWVGGEISNLRQPASGHLYFALKDEQAQVDCVMFRSRARLLPFRPRDGLRVEARALVTLYEPRGGFQLNVEALRQAGIGALYEAFARLRARLEAEGLFDPSRRLPLPRFPRRLGIVTSLQAAALHDVLAALARRAPHLPVVIYPVPVQGEGAAGEIAAALAEAARRRECDLLLLVRGGGSIEDLWAFNEEVLARAIDASPIPVLTGIGHETDTTIADLVADCRAATPTAAAELASAGWFAARDRLARLADTLQGEMHRRLEGYMQRVDLLGRRLLHPGERLARLRALTEHLATRLAAVQRRQLVTRHLALQRLQTRLAVCRPDVRPSWRRLDALATRLRTAAAATTARRTAQLERLAASLAHLSPRAVLARGYSLVRKADGAIVRSAAQLAAGEPVVLTFGHGTAEARVTQPHPDPS